MKIDIVCSSGSPTGIVPSDVHGSGVGGAELALVTTAQLLAEAGNEVRIFNNPKAVGVHGSVEYRPVGDWRPNRSDVLVLFRTPFQRAGQFNGKKIFWSCDQYTVGDFKTDVFPFVDKVVTISPFHSKYFIEKYDLSTEKIATIGICVRTWEYAESVEKVPGRVIFCSVPRRGLGQLRTMWDTLTKEFPSLSLVVTSDYRLWGAPDPMNEEFRRSWMGVPNVQFLGKIGRGELIKHQMQAQWMIYPCIYDELFCISLAECQVAGALPITSAVGALSTTNICGIALEGNPNDAAWLTQFTEITAAAMRKQSEIYDPDHIRRVSKVVFGPQVMIAAWDEVLR